MEKILLGRNKSKKSVNEDNSLNIGLSSNERVLPVDTISQTMDAYEEYLKEKDSSEVYRLIFTINPVCSNILFNANTEIVYKEGSDDCQVIGKEGVDYSGISENVTSYMEQFNKDTFSNGRLTRNEAIRDTSYSHPKIGSLEYHCGVDIFNNHILRNKEFKIVNHIDFLSTLYSGNTGEEKYFNTIRDYLRDANGAVVTENIVKISGISLINDATMLHLYQVDDVMTFKESIYQNLVEDESGWVGFINPCAMDIENVKINDEWITVNKCLNNKKAGEMVDMYPDRTLYSFVPKYNEYRNRLEYNWLYLITYPYANVKDNDLVSNNGINGIRTIFNNIDDLKVSFFAKENGETNFNILLKTQLKNTFQKGSFVTLTFIAENGASITSLPVKVEGIGKNSNDTQHYFSINFNGITDCIMNWVSENDPSWNQKINALEIRVRKYERGAECEYYIRKFKALENKKRGGVNFSNSLNKLSFAENIFSDSIAQIVFNDDIITEGTVDNYGRQISELYLTIIKNNKGYEKWYSDEPNYTDDDIEYSHCFGKISSGIDLSPEWEKYNIHRLYAGNRDENALENGITVENEDFYGDIVEFSPNAFEETVLEDVYYRFNTAQRETETSEYGKIYEDKFKNDDYDVAGKFNIEENVYPNVTNISNEGYFYKPHYQIKLRVFESNVKQGNDIKLRFNENTLGNEEGTVYSGVTEIPYYLSIGDKLYFFNEETKERVAAKVTGVSGFMGTRITFEADEEVSLDDYVLFRSNPSKPKFAIDANDGRGTYYWRDIMHEKEIMYGDELFNSVFMNGAHYFHKNINFYLKRQDPTGEYELNTNSNNIDALTGASTGKIKDISMAEYVAEGENDIC